ncbi:hypothetical protein FQR65_LT12717 [Abscondita terminalis]|nr:hypothetical protein FQR65_LT12717 [Abscondita terminalis]
MASLWTRADTPLKLQAWVRQRYTEFACADHCSFGDPKKRLAQEFDRGGLMYRRQRFYKYVKQFSNVRIRRVKHGTRIAEGKKGFLNENGDINNISGNEGIIVNIASIAAFAPVECFPIYTATKYGIIGLTKAYGTENHYKRANVKIMAVCPGATKTNILLRRPAIDVTLGADYVPLLKRSDIFQGPETVAKAVVHAISNGKTGSIWIAEEGEYYELHLPKIEGIKYQ